jgi:hypothetical protein
MPAVMPPDWLTLETVIGGTGIGVGFNGLVSVSATWTVSHLFQLARATKIVDIMIARHPKRIRARGAEMYCSTTFLSNAETNPENATAPTICQTSKNP